MSVPAPVAFGDWLRQRRRTVGISRDDLADQTACSLATLQKIEAGERRPSRQIALRLAILFHVPADEHEAFVTFARAGRPGDAVATSAARPPAPPRALASGPARAAEPGEPEDAPAHAAPAAPWRAVHLSKSNLPLLLTSLIGREHEQAAVDSLLRQPNVRLLTLTGPPGTGKTRLSIAVAAALRADMPDGVYLVELAPLSDPAMAVPAIARALGLRETGGQSIQETLLAHVKDKRMLLVLDNFEHLLDAGPEVVRLIQASPWLKALVTSREALHIRGERQYPVPPLRLPALADQPSFAELARNPAIQLFVERAADAAPDFALTTDNARDVAGVCVNLDGLPLAIELAAARVTLFPPRALLAQLGHQLAVLTDGARDLPPRQRTLRGAIAWSYDLLAAERQQLFRRMAVFQGGHTLAALAAVCPPAGCAGAVTPQTGDVAAGVESLLASHLLHQRDGSDGEPRFGMLETVHEYARDKLQESGEGAALQEAHARYCMWLAEEAELHLTGAGQQQWLARLDDEYANLRAALAWAGAHADRRAGATPPVRSLRSHQAAETGLRTAGALSRFWYARSLHTEGREQLERFLALPPEVLDGCAPRSRAKALNAAASLAWRLGDYASARGWLETALVLGRQAADTRSVATSLTTLGAVAWQEDENTAARALFEESLALRRAIGDQDGIAGSLNWIGIVSHEAGDYATARALFEEALAMRRVLGDQSGIASGLTYLGNVAHRQGDLPAARALHGESLSLWRALGDKGGIAATLTNLGNVAEDQGDSRAAQAMYEEGLALRRETRDQRGAAGLLNRLGGLIYEQGDPPGARALLGESLAIARECGDQGLTAQALHGLAKVVAAQGDDTGARALFAEGLGLSSAISDTKGAAAALAGLAALAVGAGQVTRGATLLGAVAALLGRSGAALDRDDRVSSERTGESARALLGETAFERARQAGAALSSATIAAYALEGVTSGGAQP